MIIRVLFLLLLLPTHAFAEEAVQLNRLMGYLEYHEKAALIDPKAHSVNLKKFIELHSLAGTVIFDLRSRELYEQGHIKDAIYLGSDITEEKLKSMLSSKDVHVVLYCTNSLYPVRMMSLTDISLPQFINLGYQNVYMLDAIWQTDGEINDGIEMLTDNGLWIGRDTVQ